MADGGALSIPKPAKAKHHATLAMAFFEAQRAFGPIYKDGHNAERNYRFSTFPAVRDALVPVLHAHGLAFAQLPDGVEMHDGRPTFMLLTRILHAKTGETLEGRYPVCDARLNAQDKGACLTYARRYSALSIMGVATEEADDDAANVGRGQPMTNEFDQRPAEEVAEVRGRFLEGAEAKTALNDLMTRMSESADLDALERVHREAERINVSRNRHLALGEHFEACAEALSHGRTPPPPPLYKADAPPESPFEAIKTAGEAVTDAPAAAAWFALLTLETLGRCTEAERLALKAIHIKLKKQFQESAGAGGACEDAGQAGATSGDAPGGAAPPASSSFEALKAQGLAVLSLDDARRRKAAFDTWRDIKAGAKHDLSEAERAELDKIEANLVEELNS
jgi:hypothetical protein